MRACRSTCSPSWYELLSISLTVAWSEEQPGAISFGKMKVIYIAV